MRAADPRPLVTIACTGTVLVAAASLLGRDALAVVIGMLPLLVGAVAVWPVDDRPREALGVLPVSRRARLLVQVVVGTWTSATLFALVVALLPQRPEEPGTSLRAWATSAALTVLGACLVLRSESSVAPAAVGAGAALTLPLVPVVGAIDLGAWLERPIALACLLGAGAVAFWWSVREPPLAGVMS